MSIKLHKLTQEKKVQNFIALVNKYYENNYILYNDLLNHKIFEAFQELTYLAIEHLYSDQNKKQVIHKIVQKILAYNEIFKYLINGTNAPNVEKRRVLIFIKSNVQKIAISIYNRQATISDVIQVHINIISIYYSLKEREIVKFFTFTQFYGDNALTLSTYYHKIRQPKSKKKHDKFLAILQRFLLNAENIRHSPDMILVTSPNIINDIKTKIAI